MNGNKLAVVLLRVIFAVKQSLPQGGVLLRKPGMNFPKR
jgi:hypothetical protein